MSLHFHVPYGIAVSLLIAATVIFIYLSVKMLQAKNRTQKHKEYGTIFVIMAVVCGLLLVMSAVHHYHLTKRLF